MTVDHVTWIVAVIGSVVGFGSLLHMAYIRARWPRAIGRVVGNIGEWSKSAGPTESVYFARIAFTARNGQSYEVKGDVGRRQPWPMGVRIDLWYKASKPEHALCMKVWQQLVFSGVFIAFGLVCWAKIAGVIS